MRSVNLLNKASVTILLLVFVVGCQNSIMEPTAASQDIATNAIHLVKSTLGLAKKELPLSHSTMIPANNGGVIGGLFNGREPRTTK
ncbi:MAG: hypothetical protein MAGBODY4_00321 [Candidatus Marinimicrobia bacterium]|nr:hypothetical protein [Candidatus Neomarinimicrobiota bacterium]